MPTYEYECRKCAYRFERLQSMTAEPLKKCPRCNGTVKRLISAGAGLIFKGSGFFITDYKRKKEPKPEPPASSKKEPPARSDAKKT